MKAYTSPRHKLWRDNTVLRPSEAAEQKSRKVGTAKRVGAAMAYRFLRRLEKEVVC